MGDDFDSERFPGNFYQGMILKLDRARGRGVVRSHSGKEIPFELRARARRDQVRATGRSIASVDRLFEASGGRGIFLDNPIQRAWRDVHAMRAHAGNNPERAAFVFSRSEFGLPPQDIRF